MAEQQGLFGGEEVGTFRPAGGGGGAVVGEDVGGADDGVGDPGGEVGDLAGVGAGGGRGGEQRGGGDGVDRCVAAIPAAAPPPAERVAGPKRCQPARDQWRTGAESRAAPPRTAIRSRPSGPGMAPVSRAQQRSRASRAACSAATAGDG